MSLSCCCLEEVHYCGLQSQSNVYGLTTISPQGVPPKVLAASIRGKVMSLEFQKSKNTTPSAKEIHFTYIPGDAEIVSIDAFTKPQPNTGTVVGITFIKTTDGKPFQVLNIYSQWDHGAPSDIDGIAQACDYHQLDFIPYQLMHTELVTEANKETVFLLSGGDRTVHMYRENRENQTFNEMSSDEFFPEFQQLDSNVTWINIKYVQDDKTRLTAWGCENGTVQAASVDVASKRVVNSWMVQHDGPVTSVEIFRMKQQACCPSFVPEEISEEITEETEQPYNLLVTGALDVAVVYRDLLTKGLSDPMLLPGSDKFDCILCSCVADVDLDGHNEIILGTYGQELLAYRLVTKNPSPRHSVTPPRVPPDQPQTGTSSLKDGEFQLLWRRSFAYPLMGMWMLDLTGDGLQEMVLLSQQGLHVLQQNIDEVASLCMERLKALSHVDDVAEEDAIFQELQTEHFDEEPQPDHVVQDT